MLTAQDVADFFLSPSCEDSDQITNLKLQKLLYYAQGYSLVILKRPLFLDNIENWHHGPVVRDVYHTYKDYGDSPLPFSHIEPQKYSEEELVLLRIVYKEKGQYTAWKLRNMTHEESPWLNSRRGQVITLDSIESFFKQELKQSDFNFDLGRMEERVKDDFVAVPSDLMTQKEFLSWLNK